MSDRLPFMLDDVKVDPCRLRLESPRGAMPIEPRVMDVLVGLAEHGTGGVTRVALERAVWPETHVGYHALTRAISQARKALQHLAPDRSIIETIPRRGYRLTVTRVAVEPAADVVAPAREVAPRPEPAAPPAGHWATAWAAPVMLILAIGPVMHGLGLHGSALHRGVVALALTLCALRAWRSSPAYVARP